MPPRRTTPNPLSVPQPLIVKLDQPKSKHSTPRWARLAWRFLAIVLIIALMLWSNLNYFVTETVEATTPLAVSVTLDFADKTSLRDPWLVTVSVQNNGATSLTGSLTLIAEPNDSITLSSNGSSTVKIKNLQPGGTFTQVFTFVPLEYNGQNGDFNLTAALYDDLGNSTLFTHEKWKVHVWNVPGVRRLVEGALKSGGVLAALVALFWEQFKKATFGS